MRRTTSRVILFTRFPTEDLVKTRLVGAIGAAQAAMLQRRMSEHAVKIACEAVSAERVMVFFTGAKHTQMRSWLGKELHYRQQRGSNLGARLWHAFHNAFNAGVWRAVIIGCDIPSLCADIIRDGLDALQNSDVVLGPACDGGYYLIGMQRPYPELFESVDWGSNSVCDQALGRIRRIGLRAALLPQLRDIDTPEDLETIRGDERFADVFNNDSPDTSKRKE